MFFQKWCSLYMYAKIFLICVLPYPCESIGVKYHMPSVLFLHSWEGKNFERSGPSTWFTKTGFYHNECRHLWLPAWWRRNTLPGILVSLFFCESQWAVCVFLRGFLWNKEKKKSLSWKTNPVIESDAWNGSVHSNLYSNSNWGCILLCSIRAKRHQWGINANQSGEWANTQSIQTG